MGSVSYTHLDVYKRQLVPIGVALFVKEFVFLERTAQEAVISMVAALIGMIPEGLYLLTSVALAVSMLRLARGKVLAQDMNCIETLARVDVLCVDKTGTITEPHMDCLLYTSGLKGLVM